MCWSVVFFFNDTATPEIYTPSLHDALPISRTGAQQEEPERFFPGEQRAEAVVAGQGHHVEGAALEAHAARAQQRDRKSTRLNSSHANISYAVFCLKKKKQYCKESE